MTNAICMDLSRCINCRACEVACEREHAGKANMFVQLIDESYALPLNCRHCAESYCTAACPTQAVHRLPSGSVVISVMKCIGCGLCTLACPFGSIWIDQHDRVARKCDHCQSRLEKRLDPACVATCSARALSFGDFETLLRRAQQTEAHVLINRAAGESGTIIILPPILDGKPAQFLER